MIPPHIDLGLCPLCKGTGFKKESDFTRTDCICEETGNKYFLYKLESTRLHFGPDQYQKVDYQDKSLLDKIIDHMAYGQVNYNGEPQILHINNLNRLEPFYTLNDYNLNHYSFPPLVDPLFPFPRRR
jgi:hypothetical protein